MFGATTERGVTSVNDGGGIRGGAGDNVFCNRRYHFVGGEIEEVIDEKIFGFEFLRRELLGVIGR